MMSGLRFNLALALLTIFWMAACDPDPAFKADYDRFHSIKVGMTEQEVREKLGEPVHVYERRSAPKDYYVKGYAFKKRPITNRVLIYIAFEPIAYIYFDHQNKVEEVFVGGS